MNFSFPHFTRASTDNVYTQPPQKSLLELVIEAKGRLGLVPQRQALTQHPSPSPFSHFSDSDEEGEGVDGNANEAETRQDAVLTTRTSWVPPAYLLDYFFSGEFLSVFLTLHGINASRPVSMLVPPLLTVRDAQLHPLVEAGLCAVLQDAAHSSSRQQRSGGGGGWRDGVRGGRGGRDGGERSYMESNAAAASADGPFMPYWGGAQQHQLQGGLLGADEGNDNGAAEPSAPIAAHPFCADAQRRVAEPAATPLAQRLLFRGLQQVALPALLLGDHVLLSGPRGIGKRTAALLSAGANVLAFTSNANPGAAEEADAPPAPVEGEGEAAADKPPAAAEGPASTSPIEAEAKPEETVEDTRDAADARPDPAEPAAASDPASPPAPRALIVLSSYPEVLSAAHWLGSVFGPAAFAPYTFQKDGVALRLLLEAQTAEQQPAVLDGGSGPYSSDALGHGGVMPTFPETTSGRRFIGPPLSLPFITDTTAAAGAPALPPADPTQAESAPRHAQATVPALSELAALVMNASLPAEAAGTAQGSAGERATGGDTKLKRRRHRDDEEVSDDDADEERAEKRSSRTHRRHHRHRGERDEAESDDDEIRRVHHREKRSPRSSSRHRHRSRHGDRSDRGGEAESRGERDASSHRSHRRHRRRRDEVDGGDGGKDRRLVDREERHLQPHSSHRRSSRRHHHRSRSDERPSRHRSRRHHHHHHRSRRGRDRHGEDRRSVSSSSSSSSTAASSTSSPGCQSAGPPPLVPTNAEAVLPMMLDNSIEPPAADELRALALDSVVPSAVPMVAPVTPFSAVAVAEEPSAAAEKQHEAAKEDSTAKLPDVLRQRVPLLITTYHALGMALGMVQGEASALPPLEHVRVALFVNLEKALMPPLKESFVHSWWLSLVNALDVECQFVVTADRMGTEVRGFLDSTIMPDAGERLVHFDQRDASIWAVMNVQVCAVPVEAPVTASPPNGGSEGRPRISGSDIDAAKVAHLFSTIVEHMSSTGCHATHQRGDAAFEAHRGGQGARVVIVCSARREQSLVVTQLQRLFHDQEHDTHAVMVRVTERVELFRASEAEALVLTDAQLTDPRVLRDVHQCTEVDLILHFSLPRTVMTQLEKKEIINSLAQRGRAILGSSKQFCARRWWRRTAVASAAGGGAALDAPSNAVDFVPAKVECQLLLTEYNVHGRVGSCVMEALREVSDS
ncbi:hypothetical protein, conserved [Leishmania donovani]|uniref:Uncharacterized protein n=1 Tax=Leishmania donovani TaxID=5661 RepID=E9BCQ5_LEIDO|nr:hypothetical protein, conserved [Leishmania donovani]CBZ33031.1 hypothetical protein, conserved [Leishmania donovani]